MNVNANIHPQAKIVADSISPAGHRLTTMQVTMHRFVLAEFNTHRVFSRSSASSRAIPVSTQLDRVALSPAYPISWPCEQAGMQGGAELTGFELTDAQELFEEVQASTVSAIERYLVAHPEKDTRLHKSLLNRLIEPFMYHEVVVSSTEWENFWAQRATEFSPLAQPELRAAVDPMLAAYRESTPKLIQPGEWHLPYIDPEDWEWAASPEGEQYADSHDDIYTEDDLIRRISVARVARISYLKIGVRREWEKDLDRYAMLVSAKPMHAAPLEMVATPSVTPNPPGNFTGWAQLRHLVGG